METALIPSNVAAALWASTETYCAPPYNGCELLSAAAGWSHDEKGKGRLLVALTWQPDGANGPQTMVRTIDARGLARGLAQDHSALTDRMERREASVAAAESAIVWLAGDPAGDGRDYGPILAQLRRTLAETPEIRLLAEQAAVCAASHEAAQADK